MVAFQLRLDVDLHPLELRHHLYVSKNGSTFSRSSRNGRFYNAQWTWEKDNDYANRLIIRDVDWRGTVRHNQKFHEKLRSCLEYPIVRKTSQIKAWNYLNKRWIFPQRNVKIANQIKAWNYLNKRLILPQRNVKIEFQINLNQVKSWSWTEYSWKIKSSWRNGIRKQPIDASHEQRRHATERHATKAKEKFS